MKKNVLLLVAALIVLGFAVRKVTEGFGTEAEFLDKKQVAHTVMVENSSYNQVTNHLRPSVETFGPIAGSESPFQVNQYRAHIQ